MMTDRAIKFHTDIDVMVKQGSSYIDAIVEWCEQNDQEVESVVDIIKMDQNSILKIQQEAESLNFLKPMARLPV
jgi:hypothetical protein